MNCAFPRNISRFVHSGRSLAGSAARRNDDYYWIYGGSGFPWHEDCSDAAILTFRITKVETEEEILLRVEGRLYAESLGEFKHSCKEAQLPLRLDFGGLRWIDDEATEFLRQLLSDGAVVTNASPFIALRLKHEREDTLPKMTKEEIDEAE
jgi:hypothetical protein